MKRVVFGVMVSAVLAAGCMPAGQGSAGTVYVTNERSGDLSVIDVFTQRVLTTVPLGKRPRGLRASPDHSLLYVALSGSPIAGPGVDEDTLPPADKKADGIGVVDLKTHRLLRVMPSGSDPEQVAVSLDGKILFIANEDDAKVSAIDAMSGKVIAEMEVGGEPEGVNLRPDGKEVWVTSENDGAVFVINAAKPEVVQKIPVGHRPRSTTFSPDSAPRVCAGRERRHGERDRHRHLHGRGHDRALRYRSASDGRCDLERWEVLVHDDGPRQDGGDHRHGDEYPRRVGGSGDASLGRGDFAGRQDRVHGQRSARTTSRLWIPRPAR